MNVQTNMNASEQIVSELVESAINPLDVKMFNYDELKESCVREAFNTHANCRCMDIPEEFRDLTQISILSYLLMENADLKARLK